MTKNFEGLFIQNGKVLIVGDIDPFVLKHILKQERFVNPVVERLEDTNVLAGSEVGTTYSELFAIHPAVLLKRAEEAGYDLMIIESEDELCDGKVEYIIVNLIAGVDHPESDGTKKAKEVFYA